jgi:FlaA1/EpsC-like NDP-sugar epimerase
MPARIKVTPVWIIFIADLFICLVAIWSAYMLRFNFHIPAVEINTFSRVFPTILSIRALSFLISRTYKGIIFYTSSKDAERIFITISSGALLLMLANPIFAYFKGVYIVPYSIIILDAVLSIFFMSTMRMMVKLMYSSIINYKKEKYKVLIYGAGETGLMSQRAIEKDANAKYSVIGFLDDDPKLKGKKIQGYSIHDASQLPQLLQVENPKLLIIAIENLPSLKKQEIVELCLAHNVKVLNVPPLKRWIKGELSFKQIKKVNIEDLLEREPIALSQEAIADKINEKSILVTGAAGSIGSEIVRQLMRFSPKKIFLLDQAESALYDLENELKGMESEVQFEIIIADVRSRKRMRKVFNHCCPHVVFHAAAYKHVPLMELNPSEALLTNIKGTKTLADLSHEKGVTDFVMISTDKAVNPTNVMGASKRISEMYVQALSAVSETKFITTRFGNVLGSNGSVIPLFNKQIERGGPITVTHPDITRYFMTIPEACQLVLEAASHGKGGEIFIFDMGKSVKIVDLAKKMIKLSGLTLDKDIEIVYTGLRPGEKLYEELLNDKENVIPTHHPQIMKAKVSPEAYADINEKVNNLIALFDEQDNIQIVTAMKALVPEFISNNSEFELLDLQS